MSSSSASRLAALRALLQQEKLDGLIIPHSDEFLGEYIPACAERLAWATGFTGSAGLAIVLNTTASVFSDGRYITQMDQQVDKNSWQCNHIYETPPSAWLTRHATAGQRIGYDARTISHSELNAIRSASTHLEFIATHGNLIDRLWTDRPAFPSGRAAIHPLVYAGEDSLSKRTRLAQALSANKIDTAVLSDSASIAWLLNIRGRDIPCTPVVLAFALLHADATVDLFIEPNKLPEDVKSWLGTDVRSHAPQQMEEILATLNGKTVSLDPASGAVWFAETLTRYHAVIKENPDPCLLPKALKNTTEQAGAREAHLKDGAALCRFLHWLESHTHTTSELEAATKLDAFRAEEDGYCEESFNAISGAGPNGAVIHYRVTEESNRSLHANEVYLIDSGGQYPEGTTDVTRTIWTGPDAPPQSLKETFTRVLKGNLRLGRVRFPAGTAGHALDTLARFDLWQAGLDYDHGTGHGVGSFLSVHEGPVRISKVPGTIAIQEGMILSNEPGYYKTGAFGIRLETLILAQPFTADDNVKPFLSFETLTLVPFDRTLIDVRTLGAQDTELLNDYHACVFSLIGPRLHGDSRLWLKKACAPLVLV